MDEIPPAVLNLFPSTTKTDLSIDVFELFGQKLS